MTSDPDRTAVPEDSDPLPKYAPHSVPPRHERFHSIRDDVRRTIVTHSFRPSTTHFTRLSDIYSLFLSDNNYLSSNIDAVLEDKFRSALGRVLRPPSTADAFAQSFSAAHVVKLHGFISLVSPHCEAVDLCDRLRKGKHDNGRRRREEAGHNQSIAQLRETRRVRKINALQQPQSLVPPQQVSFRYVDELLSMTCAEDLLKLKIFPNGKELAESMSAYSAVRHYLHSATCSDNKVSFNDPTTTLVAVGDGCTPRTATLFAFRTQWKCYSIDPALRTGPWHHVSNLTVLSSRVQNARVPIPDNGGRIVVVMWHAHVSISDAMSCLSFNDAPIDMRDQKLWSQLRRRVALVSCYCCNFDPVQRVMPDGSAPDVEYEDSGVPGLMRTVRVWKFLDDSIDG